MLRPRGALSSGGATSSGLGYCLSVLEILAYNYAVAVAYLIVGIG